MNMMQKTKTIDLLYFLNISKISGENLYQWVKRSLGSPKYNLEIMAIIATLNLASPEDFCKKKTHRKTMSSKTWTNIDVFYQVSY